MGFLNCKGSVSSWSSLKRSVLKPLLYSQFDNTFAVCLRHSVISGLCEYEPVYVTWYVSFPLSIWRSKSTESHGTDSQKHACRTKTGMKFKMSALSDCFQVQISYLGCNDTMGKSKLPNRSTKNSGRKRSRKREQKAADCVWRSKSFLSSVCTDKNLTRCQTECRFCPGNQKAPNRLIKVFPSGGENPRMTSGYPFNTRNLT